MLDIRKFFTWDISKADETRVEFSIDTKEVGKTWYEEAVRDVLIERVTDKVREYMVEKCYSAEQIKDTKAVLSKYNAVNWVEVKDEEEFHENFREYPKAVTGGWGNGYAYYGLSFYLETFIANVVGDFYE